MIDVKPGQNAGPTRQGIDTRITNWKPINQIVDYSDPAHARVLDSSSKQLVLIPIVEDPNGGTNWLNGSGQVRVIGFAWFVITGPPGYTANGKTVTGTFVGLEDPATAGDQTGRLEPEREPEPREHDRSDASRRPPGGARWCNNGVRPRCYTALGRLQDVRDAVSADQRRYHGAGHRVPQEPVDVGRNGR